MGLTDRLRIGAQFYDRNLGNLGDWHPSLDWAFADYQIKHGQRIKLYSAFSKEFGNPQQPVKVDLFYR